MNYLKQPIMDMPGILVKVPVGAAASAEETARHSADSSAASSRFDRNNKASYFTAEFAEERRENLHTIFFSSAISAVSAVSIVFWVVSYDS
jgi:hypothetical protein